MNEYTAEFYTNELQGSRDGASIILPIVFDAVKPRSVLDFGCGAGTWLSAAKKLGAERTVGIDGPWADNEVLEIERDEFVSFEAESDAFPEIGHFDLAVSMEVLEHISDEAAKRALDAIAGRVKYILLSVAIPGQGGLNHINEQWQEHYAGHLRQRGFVVWDLVRPMIWHNDSVPVWYRQNALFFVREDLAGQFDIPAHPLLDVVHPSRHVKILENLHWHQKKLQRRLGRRLKRAVRHAVRGR